MRKVSPLKRLALLACMVHVARTRARNDLAEMFCKRIAQVTKLAKAELTEIREREAEISERLIINYRGARRAALRRALARARCCSPSRPAPAPEPATGATSTRLCAGGQIPAGRAQRRRPEQADAILAARKTMVLGAVGLGQMALAQLADSDLVELDPEQKAAMVSNLMVVLSGDHSPTPVINTGSLST